MVEPITTLTAATIATIVMTKAFEKTGERVATSALDASGKLLALLRRKSPNTAAQIEEMAQSNQQTEAGAIDAGTAQIVANTIDGLARKDEEIKAALNDVMAAVQAQPGSVLNFAQLAQRIGLVIQGGNNSVNIENLNI